MEKAGLYIVFLSVLCVIQKGSAFLGQSLPCLQNEKVMPDLSAYYRSIPLPSSSSLPLEIEEKPVNGKVVRRSIRAITAY